MYWDVTKVEPLPDYRIRVELENGRKGIFDLTPYLELGVFRELKDPAYFNQVFVLFGAVTWPNEQDIAPETLLAELVEVHEAASPASPRRGDRGQVDMWRPCGNAGEPPALIAEGGNP